MQSRAEQIRDAKLLLANLELSLEDAPSMFKPELRGAVTRTEREIARLEAEQVALSASDPSAITYKRLTNSTTVVFVSGIYVGTVRKVKERKLSGAGGFPSTWFVDRFSCSAGTFNTRKAAALALAARAAR